MPRTETDIRTYIFYLKERIKMIERLQRGEKDVNVFLNLNFELKAYQECLGVFEHMFGMK